MSITALSTQPNSVTRPDTFNTDSDTFHSELPTFITEANALAAAMNAVAAGGAVSMQYAFDSTTTDSDPGSGILRLDNATQNTATTIRVDDLDSNGIDLSGMIELIDNSTSTNKGYLTLRDADEAGKWIVFSVSAVTDQSGYYNIAVSVAASSATNPLTDSTSVLLDFSPTGDKGETGSTDRKSVV